MSQHEVVKDNKRYMFGWDQPLQSFYLQVHDENLDEEENPFVWLGATGETMMLQVDDLVRAARQHDLDIDPETKLALYNEKDEGV